MNHIYNMLNVRTYAKCDSCALYLLLRREWRNIL